MTGGVEEGVDVLGGWLPCCTTEFDGVVDDALGVVTPAGEGRDEEGLGGEGAATAFLGAILDWDLLLECREKKERISSNGKAKPPLQVPRAPLLPSELDSVEGRAAEL